MKLSFTSLLLLFYLQTPLAAPMIVAHRAGTADHPENTLHAINMALQNSANVIWLSLQFTKEGIPVLYRPSDLNTLTDGHGPVSAHHWQEIQQLDAAYHFNIQGQYIYRGLGVKIPTLRQALIAYPNAEFILDIKSPDADPAIMAEILDELLTETNSLDRVRFYSTEKRYLTALPATMNKFKPRNLTRKILANAIMANYCELATTQDKKSNRYSDEYHAFELRRDVRVVEKFTLGRGTSKAQLVWSPAAMACFKHNPNTKVLLIGISSYQDYQIAQSLGADYVMVDSPAAAKHWR
ncbi:glycerophosphodiester phosphodiesterase family protein [Yersinia hibernica]|uniref:Glycerophosphodiester phosphodiesterase n=1 Tax=Yersinia hibernica TaxID=2339259 RepID=A0ABX5QZU4_9GAMM|nr:glycerophosphodiester phosphodiesterase family protein [Yersinia hibernica]QAX78823.1 glycerophosphodiester phosphodiesterase [Yersinia hibernica]